MIYISKSADRHHLAKSKKINQSTRTLRFSTNPQFFHVGEDNITYFFGHVSQQ